jgi:AcrR family transcriptional regulator
MSDPTSSSPRSRRRPGRRAAARRATPATDTRIPELAEARVRLPRRLAPRKSPTQARAQETVEAILEGAVQLFSTRGYARTSTNEIARRAGVSVGSLYQYFPNKDALLMTLLARHLEAVGAAVAESMPVLDDPRVPLREGIRQLLERLRDLHESDPRLARAVEQQAGHMPLVPEGLAEHKRAHLETVAAILRRRPDVRAGNHDLMALLLTEVTEAVSGFLVHGLPGRFGRDEALAEAVEAVCRYVEGPETAAPAASRESAPEARQE